MWWWRNPCLVADGKTDQMEQPVTVLLSTHQREVRPGSEREGQGDIWPLNSDSSQQEERSEKSCQIVWAITEIRDFKSWQNEQRQSPQQTGPAKGINGFWAHKQTLDMSKQLMWECLYLQSKRNIVFNLVWLMLNACCSADRLPVIPGAVFQKKEWSHSCLM